MVSPNWRGYTATVVQTCIWNLPSHAFRRHRWCGQVNFTVACRAGALLHWPIRESDEFRTTHADVTELVSQCTK
jgi:hypothetical protein